MGRRGISRVDVQNAINTLERKHENVTIMAIRNALGTGSVSTIQSLLKDIRDEQGQQHRVIQEIPEGLTTTFKDMLNELWKVAQSLASADVEILRKATTAEIDRLRSDMTAVCDSFDSMSVDLDECKEQLKTEQVRSAKLEKGLADALSAKTALESQYKALVEGFNASAKKIEGVIASVQSKDNAQKANRSGN